MNKLFIICICVVLLIGCRGWKSEKPPIHPNINLDFQAKIKAQVDPQQIPNNASEFNRFETDNSLWQYSIDDEFIKDGQKYYNIYCASCHTQTGNGIKSIISQNGWVVSNILEDVTYNKSDSELYSIIDYGIRSMPGYGKKLSNKEIWQVVLYVRALQKLSRASNYEIKKVRGE